MTTTGIDPRIQADVLRMARNGMPLGQIGAETGLMDKEVRLIIDGEKRRLAGNPTTAAAVRQLPPTRAPAAQPAAPPAPVAPRQTQDAPADSIAALIDQAEASDMAKVRTAARRAVLALDNLRNVMDATEQERRQKAAAKAKAEKEKADRAEKERVARVFRDELARQLEKADAELAELTGKPAGKPRKTTPMTPQRLEALRANAAKGRAAIAAKKAAQANA